LLLNFDIDLNVDSGLTAASLSERARLTAMCQLFQQQAAWPLATLAQQLSLSAAWDAERLVVRCVQLYVFTSISFVLTLCM
jgi:DUF1365 family protein